MAAEATKIPFVEGSAPATPAANRSVIYVKSDGLFYSKDDAGVETLMSSGSSGNVATDAIWDAKGDLAAGTGANTAAKVTVGANDTMLKADSAQSTGMKWGYPVASVAKVATGQTTTSTSFADLATSGPSVTVTVPASGKVKLSLLCQMQNSGANQCFVGVDISGANTVAAATILSDNGTVATKLGATQVLTGLSTGSTTFKMQYAVGAGTGTFTGRELVVELVD